MAGAGNLDALVEVAGHGAAEFALALEERLGGAVGNLGEADLGLINADLGPHNTVWSGRRPGLVDFNDSGWGPFAFDLARMVQNLSHRGDGRALAQAALAGYQELTPLPVGYAECGSLFKAAADMFLARYLAPKVTKRGPETLQRVVDLVQAAMTAA